MATKPMQTFQEYLFITFGLFVNAIGWVAFLIPAKVVGGGVSGLAAIIYFATGIPMAIWYFLINAALLLLALWKIGPLFGVKTVYSVVGLSILFSILPRFIHGPLVQDTFMAALIGGFLAGAGVGVVFTQGGSTGGTDVIAMFMNRYRSISMGRTILVCDLLIIGSSYLVFRSSEKLVYGYVTMAVIAYAVDAVIEGRKESAQIFVFSKDASNAIADRIGNELHRGATFLNGRGWYTGEDCSVVMVVVRKNEIHQVYRIIKEEDPKAFLSVGRVMGVYGKGFEKINIVTSSSPEKGKEGKSPV